MKLTNHEAREIEHANQSGLRPVVFVHGLWLLPNSWDRWRNFFERYGYATLAPGWPDDPETVAEAREHPEVFAKQSLQAVTEHYVEAIEGLSRKPAVVGHSFGGMIAEELAGLGFSAATVAIDPAPFRGVLPLPASSLKSAAPVIANPANYRRAVELTLDEFKYGWANTLSDEEAAELHETYHVAASGKPLFQAALANINPWTEDRVDTDNANRGPLLLISGEQDHTVPPAVVEAAYERQLRNTGETELATIPGRGHSLTIDHGWKDVAETALAFVVKYAPAIDKVTTAA